MSSGHARATTRWWEGVVSVIGYLLLRLVASQTRHPVLMTIANLAGFLCILAAVVWIGRAIVRRTRG